MKEKIKDGLIGVAVYGLMFGVPIGLAALSSDSVEDSVAPVSELLCSTETIPFEEEEQETFSLEKGEEEIDTFGSDGEREICTRDGEEVSNEVTIHPTNQVTSIGLAEPEPEASYNYSYRTGALCSDGTYSSATGRGACSWHGGVSQWLYE